MNKTELIERLAKENGLTKAEAKIIAELTFQKMTDALAQGNRIEFRGLGSFEVREYGEYRGRDPKTGKRIKVPPKKLPFFRTGRELKRRVDFK